MSYSSHAHRYQEIEVNTASPTELVVLLYDGAIGSLQKAEKQIEARDIAGRTNSINKAASILTELQANLNFEAGGEIARSLDRLYTYMRGRVFQANLDQDAEPLREVAELMTGLRSAWAEVARGETVPEKGRTASVAPATGEMAAVAGADGARRIPLNLTA